MTGSARRLICSSSLAPLIGLVPGLLMVMAVAWILPHSAPRRVDRCFRRRQLFRPRFSAWATAATTRKRPWASSLSLLIAASGNGRFEAPIVPHGGGARLPRWPWARDVVRRLAHRQDDGQRIIKLRPVDGFCAETAAAVDLGLTIVLRRPGQHDAHHHRRHRRRRLAEAAGAVRWGVAGRVVWAWVLTIPGTVIVSMICWWVLSLL